jgi:hypothetical protein
MMIELNTSYTLSQVPYITYDALEDYAEKIVADFAPGLLKNPGIIGMDEFLEYYLRLTVDFRRICLNRMVLGITAFNDGVVDIIDEDTGLPDEIEVTTGTVILDTSLTAKRSEPRLRFSGFHEGSHWLIHRKAFASDNPFGPAGIYANKYIATKEGRGDYIRSTKERNDYERMERQADFLAAGILMPRPALREVYRKAEDDRNQLVIDEYPANIVRDIFRMKIEGMSALKISETLNNLGVLSPLEYKKDRGLPHPKGGYTYKDGTKWSPHTVIRILQNETYAGTLIQGRQGTFNYKIKDVIERPMDEWKRTENAHEAIVKPQDFDLAQRIMRLDTRTAPGGASVYLFSGILVCGCCGARMTRKAVPYKGEKYLYYYCPTTKKRGCVDAPMLKEADLHEYVLECVKAQVNNIATLDSILAGSDGQKAAEALAKQYATQIAENERQLDKITSVKSTLYENLVTRLITKDDYKTMKAQYTADENCLRGAISLLEQQRENVLAGNSNRLRWMEHFMRFEGLTELDRRMVINLIQSVRVISKTELHITFNYQSEFEKALAILRREAA